MLRIIKNSIVVSHTNIVVSPTKTRGITHFVSWYHTLLVSLYHPPEHELKLILALLTDFLTTRARFNVYILINV